ncbi:TPA: outer membrane usher protein [Escherichia coli]|uniref:outer membrane usher protein n=1 Tax=Escherichia coli TaxID=562 RepID=UPI002878829F|nr:outer membrane usher protein [Escherichia coli]MDS1597743.1 outer membrane usher protein [Escherichia coli]HAW1060190.1 outer membrane usher protein [Escherichia coli]
MANSVTNIPKKTLLTVCCALIYSNYVLAEEAVEYDSSFLMGSGAATIDVSRYTEGNPTLPGIYNVSVFVNDKAVSNLTLPFIDVGTQSAAACLTAKNLAQLHILQPDNSVVLIKRDSEDGDCLDMAKSYDQAQVRFDVGEQRLDVTVPQAFVLKGYQGYVDPSLWESGINAAMLSYSINAYHNAYSGDSNDSVYASFNSGINLGAWHLRARGNYSWDNNGVNNFDFQNRYLQRDLPSLRSQLIVGEAYTTGETFDSVNVRGARLYSDSRMLPSSLSSYAPIIRGVANTNAKVTITQGGYKIYEATVPPGAFTIDDITPSGFGSELLVTIEEADGSKRTFTQPFSSVVQMQRPGVGRWDISAGQVIDDDLHHEPNLAQFSYYYGFNNFFTGYTGIQVTDNNYAAGLLGVGINTSVGAFAIDVTHSRTEIPSDKTYQGQSYRVTWNKLIESTDTSINLAAYRYSTQDYLGLHDALTLIDDANHARDGEKYNTMSSYERMKNQFTISLNQPLKMADSDWGSLYMSTTWTDYWAGSDSRTDYNLGYSKGVSWGSFSMNFQRTWNEDGKKDDSVYFSVSVPLENLLGGYRPKSGFRSLTSQVNSDLNGNHQFNTNLSGGNEDNALSYSVNTAYSVAKDSKDITSLGGYMSYDSQYGGFSASASADTDNSRQYSLSAEGGFVLHSGGLTFTNDSFSDADTMVLVNAPGAKGARLNNSTSTIDRWGYGIASSLSPYRENRVDLDIDSMEDNVELKSTSAMTVPRSGSIVIAKFETDQGRAAVLEIASDAGKPIPFAAEVFENDKMIGNMGQGGQAYVRGIQEQGVLSIRWFENNQPVECLARYAFPDTPETSSPGSTLFLNNLTCHMAKH